MKIRANLVSSILALSLASSAWSAPVSEIDQHIDAAKKAAGLDFRGSLIPLCFPSPFPAQPRPAADRPAGPPATPEKSTWYASPYKVFDNLYRLGTRQHSSWILKTSAGLILIDTNFSWAIEPEIVDGMKKLGLDPAQVKYLILSHAHGDHDQGTTLFQSRYAPRSSWVLLTGMPP